MLRGVVAFVLGLTLMWGVLGTQKVFSMGSTQFGTYSKEYLDRKQLKSWRELCKGGGRKPDPCKPKAKEWVR